MTIRCHSLVRSYLPRDLAYDDLGLPLTGLLCWDEAQDGPRPGILLIHGGAGLDAHAREQARRYAALGYTVLACDMFGPGVAGNRERVMACLLALRDDPALLVRRARAGLTALAGCPEKQPGAWRRSGSASAAWPRWPWPVRART